MKKGCSICMVFVILVLFDATTALASPCRYRRPRARRMINGDDNLGISWHFAVFFNFHQPNPMWKVCGGSLIHRQWVLTVAHCIEDIENEPHYITIGVGRTCRTWWPGKHNFTASRFFIHPNFVLPRQRISTADISIDNDIALIQLSRPVPDYIKPVGLASSKDNISDEKLPKCRSAGWGKMARITDVKSIFTNTYKVSDRLRKIDVKLITKATCIKQDNISRTRTNFFGKKKDLSRIICGGTKYRHAQYGCIGDSGSPLVCEKNGKQILQGLVAGGDSFCRSEKSAMYFTEVARHRDWIDRMIKKWQYRSFPTKFDRSYIQEQLIPIWDNENVQDVIRP